MGKLPDFTKGMIVGFCVGIIIVGLAAGLLNRRYREKELANYVLEYAEKQQAIDVLREDYSNRDPYEFIDSIPGVRGAADGAAADFERNRDEILHRFRNRLADR